MRKHSTTFKHEQVTSKLWLRIEGWTYGGTHFQANSLTLKTEEDTGPTFEIASD